MSTSIESIDSYSQITDQLVKRYKGLVSHTNDLLFQWWSTKVIDTPQINGMPKWANILFRATAPYITADHFNNPVSLIIYLAWIFLAMLWTSATVVFVIITVSPDVLSRVPQEPKNSVVSIILVVFAIFIPSILIQAHTLWFLLTKRVSFSTRLAWLIGLITFFISLQRILIAQNPNELSKIIGSEWFPLALWLIILPTSFIIIFNIIFWLKLAIEFLINLGRAFSHLHSPLSLSKIQELANSVVVSTDSTWALSELSLVEIRILKEWAKENLDISEKKTIPTAILLGALAVFTTFPQFNLWISGGIQGFLTHAVELMIPVLMPEITFERIIMDIPILFALMYILISYLLLFQNIITQGIVLQACLVAEYAAVKVEYIKKQTRTTGITNFFEVIISLISNLFNKP